VAVEDIDLSQLDDAPVAEEQMEADVKLKLEATPPAGDGMVLSLSNVLDAGPCPQNDLATVPRRKSARKTSYRHPGPRSKS
jgi:hypothetical protein